MRTQYTDNTFPRKLVYAGYENTPKQMTYIIRRREYILPMLR